MAEDRDPGLDNQERPERDAMEQGHESSENSPRFDLPEQETDDDSDQDQPAEDER
jgi:hypothetical protein